MVWYYGFPTTTALAFSDDVVVINSFSKYYCMTGWRIGWMVVPAGMTRAVECLSQNIALSVNALSQRAALAAFDATAELEAVKAGYATNRALLLERLPAMGLGTFMPPDGAFYLYANTQGLAENSMDLARRLLDEAGLAVTPGLDFDSTRGSDYLRFSFAGRHEDVVEGMNRLAGWLR